LLRAGGAWRLENSAGMMGMGAGMEEGARDAAENARQPCGLVAAALLVDDRVASESQIATVLDVPADGPRAKQMSDRLAPDLRRRRSAARY